MRFSDFPEILVKDWTNLNEALEEVGALEFGINFGYCIVVQIVKDLRIWVSS